MNTLDLVVMAAAVPAAVGGYRLGFLARALSWVGLVAGLLAAARLLPRAVAWADSMSPQGRFALAAALLVGGALGGQALGLLLGSRLRPRTEGRAAHLLDGVGGAVAGAAGVLAAVWLLLPALADVPGDSARLARNSAVAALLDRYAPRPPDALHALSQLVGEERFPEVFDALRPSPETGPAPGGVALDPALIDQTRASVVQIRGDACGRVQEGTGFVAQPGVVVTNAHVVAGERDPFALSVDGRRLDADVVYFDPRVDVAVLDVPGLRAAPLPLGEGDEGEMGAIFGYPGGGPLQLSPYRVAERVEAVGRDLYGGARTRRQVLVLAAELSPGDSGGPLVDGTGHVAGMAFAIAPDRPSTAYALATDEVRDALAAPREADPSTGPCLR